MRHRTRVAAAAVLSAAGAFAAAGPAQATTRVVHPGESIQAAIDASNPGDIVSVSRGTYRASLQISTDRIRLRGHGAVLRQPASPASTVCNQQNEGTTTGICVVGDVQPQPNGPPKVVSQVHRVTISGFAVRGFSGDGVFAFASNRLTVRHDRLIYNGGYGSFSNTSTRTSYLDSLARRNGDAGFYVGDSPNARTVVRNVVSRHNAGEGILLRNARIGRVSHSRFEGNCAGILVLADAPGPARRFTIENNGVHANNNGACHGDPSSGEPPVSGIGIALVGAQRTTVAHNVVTGQRDRHPSFASGGIVVTKGGQGTQLIRDRVVANRALNNRRRDLFWDRSGQVRFRRNVCRTSVPAGLCRAPRRRH